MVICSVSSAEDNNFVWGNFHVFELNSLFVGSNENMIAWAGSGIKSR